MHDIQHLLSPTSSIAPAVVTTTTNGAAVDTQGYDAVALLFRVAGIGGTSPSYTPKIQTSADGSTNWVDLDASAYLGEVAPSAMTANGLTYVGVKSANGAGQQMLRFVRAVVTVSGTSPTAGVVGEFILGWPRHTGVAV